jgi:hypothetical protein
MCAGPTPGALHIIKNPWPAPTSGPRRESFFSQQRRGRTLRWKREDTGYAVAALLAAIAVGYFIVANFGLVPSPLPTSDVRSRPSVDVPAFGEPRVDAISPPVFSTPKPAGPSAGRTPAVRPDRTPRPVPVTTPARTLLAQTTKTVGPTIEAAGGLIDTLASVVRTLLGHG